MQRKNWQHPIVVLLLSLLFSPLSSAFSTISFADYLNHDRARPVITLTGGSAFNSNLGESKNFPAEGGVFSFYNYSAYHSNQNPFIFGGFIGVEFLLNSQWLLQTGLGYYQPSAFHVKGIVTQGVDVASSDQYSYQYDIQSRQLLLESKLLYHWRHYYPYLSAGMGASWNTSLNYNVNIQPPFTTFSNQFTNNMNTAFSYNIGLGFDMDLTDALRLGVGYRFTDFGSSQTGTATIDTIAMSSKLAQSHVYANEILIQLTAFVL